MQHVYNIIRRYITYTEIINIGYPSYLYFSDIRKIDEFSQ